MCIHTLYIYLYKKDVHKIYTHTLRTLETFLRFFLTDNLINEIIIRFLLNLGYASLILYHIFLKDE